MTFSTITNANRTTREAQRAMFQTGQFAIGSFPNRLVRHKRTWRSSIIPAAGRHEESEDQQESEIRKQSSQVATNAGQQESSLSNVLWTACISTSSPSS